MSSKRRLRRQACKGKIVYTVRQDAIYHARLMYHKGQAMHAYKCPFGQHWHVGH